MLIIPAIDLQDGRCVRLLHGAFGSATRYGDPLAQIRDFARAGATWAHIVDLDGARARQPVQFDLVARIARETDTKLQCGGGVRTHADVATLLESGVARAVVGSLAATAPETVREWIAEFGTDRVCAAFDVRPAGETWQIATSGWTEDSGKSLDDALSAFPPGTLRHALVTDISRDGALTGPNIDLMRQLRAKRPDIVFQASGGVSSLDDLTALRGAGAAAAIVGRALYEQRFTLEAALAL